MKKIEGGLEMVPGYSFSAMECGIRKPGRLDYCIIAADKPCVAVGVFTTNKFQAAPVLLCKDRIKNPVRAILINATNANASTGKQGYDNAVSLTDAVAKELNAKSDSILMASTGVIGYKLPVDKMLNAVPVLVKSLSQENGSLVPNAIMTTDTYPKSCAVSFSTSQGEFRIAGTAKGSGMIAPNMATLLSFIITDCPVEREILDPLFRRCINKSYNSITIDGDMSTNDTAVLLSPVSEKCLRNESDIMEFEKALEYVLLELARMLVMDGEGATKFLTINVTGAENDEEARIVARSVSESLLVKTAFFGKDPNWGRIACAAGYAGAMIKPESLSIYIENIALLKNGKPCEFDISTMDKILSGREISVLLDLGIGKGEAKFFTCDISYDYVKINSEYTT